MISLMHVGNIKFAKALLNVIKQLGNQISIINAWCELSLSIYICTHIYIYQCMMEYKIAKNQTRETP